MVSKIFFVIVDNADMTGAFFLNKRSEAEQRKAISQTIRSLKSQIQNEVTQDDDEKALYQLENDLLEELQKDKKFYWKNQLALVIYFITVL